MKAIAKCSNWDLSPEKAKDFRFASYFYLHGKVEDNNGYDCCEGNLEFFSNIIRKGVSFVTVLMPDNREDVCLLFANFEFNHMTGLICLVNDLESIKSVKNYFKSGNFSFGMVDSEEQILREKYPDTADLIQWLNK